MPYLGLAGLLVLLAAVMAVLRLPHVDEDETGESESEGESLPDAGSAWGYSHLVLGAVGIFVYVGAEVSIGSFLVNFFVKTRVRINIMNHLSRFVLKNCASYSNII